MEYKQASDNVKSNGIRLADNNLPTITFTADTEHKLSMEELEPEMDYQEVPFSHYEESENENSDANIAEQLVINEDKLQADVKHLAKLDTRSEGQPGSRKVSFHSDKGSQCNSRKVSPNADGGVYMPHMQYLHPAYSGIPIAPNCGRISTQPCGYTPPHSRKSSGEVFYIPQHIPRYSHHGKVSVFSIGNASDTGTICGDTTESVPHLDHYRVSVFDNQRPTLYQLRDDDQVIKC